MTPDYGILHDCEVYDTDRVAVAIGSRISFVSNTSQEIGRTSLLECALHLEGEFDGRRHFDQGAYPRCR
jgi:hypothetical protein